MGPRQITVNAVAPGGLDDDFNASVTVNAVMNEKDGNEAAWSSEQGFSGPVDPPLDVWQRFAQVLLLSNEFLTVD